jgi:hypothetical protein
MKFLIAILLISAAVIGCSNTPITEAELKQAQTPEFKFVDINVVPVVEFFDTSFPDMNIYISPEHLEAMRTDTYRYVSLELTPESFHRVLGWLSELLEIRYIIQGRDIVVYPTSSAAGEVIFKYEN